jgi:hypothetical protein
MKKITDERLNFLRDLADRIYKGEVYCSWWIRKGDEHMLPSIFMPLMFMEEKDRKDLMEQQVSFFYANMNSSAPRSVNGYPIFYEVGYLNKNEHEVLYDIYTRITAAVANAKAKVPRVRRDTDEAGGGVTQLPT